MLTVLLVLSNFAGTSLALPEPRMSEEVYDCLRQYISPEPEELRKGKPMSALASQISVLSASQNRLVSIPEDHGSRAVRLRQDRRRRYTAMAQKTYGDSKQAEYLLLKTLCLAQFMDANDARIIDLTAVQ